MSIDGSYLKDNPSITVKYTLIFCSLEKQPFVFLRIFRVVGLKKDHL